jgi:hypothetical protein
VATRPPSSIDENLDKSSLQAEDPHIAGNALIDLSLFNLGYIKDEEKTKAWKIFKAFYSLKLNVAYNLSLNIK